MRRTRTVSICLEPDIHDWIKQYASENYTSVSAAIKQLILAAKNQEANTNAEKDQSE